MVQVIRDIVNWLYCLDLSGIVLSAGLLSAVYVLVNIKCADQHWWKWVMRLLLLVSIVTILDVTLGKRTEAVIAEAALIPFHSYREVMAGGDPEILRSNFMNVLLFYPAGLLAASLLPRKWHPVWRVLLVTAVFCAMSAGIEYVQYTQALGRVEIDDVIHNTAGALLGGTVGCLHWNKK